MPVLRVLALLDALLLAAVAAALVARRLARHAPPAGVVPASALPAAPPAIWANAELIASTRAVRGTVELWDAERCVGFRPREPGLLGDGAALRIPLGAETSLYQAFAPVEWDARNTIAVRLPQAQALLRTDRLFLRFAHAYDVEVWYRHLRERPFAFPRAAVSRDAAGLLVRAACHAAVACNARLPALNRRLPLRSLPLLALDAVHVGQIPAADAALARGYDGGFALDVRLRTALLRPAVLRVALRVAGLPFVVRVKRLRAALRLRMNQKASPHGWAEVRAPLHAVVAVTLGDHVPLLLLSALLTWLATLAMQLLAGAVFAFRLDGRRGSVDASTFRFQSESFTSFATSERVH